MKHQEWMIALNEHEALISAEEKDLKFVMKIFNHNIIDSETILSIEKHQYKSLFLQSFIMLARNSTNLLMLHRYILSPVADAFTEKFEKTEVVLTDDEQQLSTALFDWVVENERLNDDHIYLNSDKSITKEQVTMIEKAEKIQL